MVQLAHLVDVSGTINGTYRVIGADHAEVADLLRSLANATGRSPESMVSPLHGQVADGGLLPSILLGCMIAASILLLLILIFESVRALPVLGVHLLLGRSRWGFGITMFRSVLVSTAVAVVLSMLLTVALAHGYQLNATLLAAAWSGAVVGAAPALVAIAIGAAVLSSVKPVTAILGRYSKRILLWAVAASSLLATAAVSVLFAYIDGPVREAGKLTEVGRVWAGVANQQILYQLKSGNDDASITGQSSQLAKDFYHWYRSIADKPGVTLVHTAYFDREVIEGWAGVYKSPPTQPFWYMAASPSSLADQGFPVSADVVARAKRGERVFLLPDTWTDAAKQAMRGWVTEDTHEWSDPSIRTEYYNGEKIGFKNYSPKTPLFSWATDPKLPATVTDPVILVITPENMVPYESESLNAVGLENSYVKLSAAAAQKYTSIAYLARYHLDDNRVQFLAVSEFIAGLTKTIQTTLQLFGGVILFALILVVVTLVALLRLFSTTYREALAVKRMLGYSLTRLFIVPIVLVGTTGAIAVLASILLQSKSAIFGNVMLLAIQMALITFLIRRYSRLQLSAALKE
ncbi:hypothetical protein LK09_12835 [Microbacterium mangrovi]|uniref:ABC3 transporter permease protein domain-containing protein n=1 Tax=Microbacterium mangrovi TaxID=1348253 RepID=A0A0B2A6G9_9MICO|nr:hypothetical protein LK09_12835 [Microbacterium mangrovi]